MLKSEEENTYCVKIIYFFVGFRQDWGAGAGCFWLFGAGAAWKKTRSRSSLEKKSGAGAAKKLTGSSALREDEKNKEIVLYSLDKIVSFYG